MTDWEYRKFDLNLHRPQGDELDLLNAAGAEGWELIGITSNNIAYLKRELEVVAGQRGTAEPDTHCPNGMEMATTPRGRRGRGQGEIP